MALKESTKAAATVAVKKPDFIGSYFRNGLISNLKIIIVITVLNLIAFPVALISLTYDMHMEELAEKSSDFAHTYYDGNSTWFIVLACMFTVVTVLSGVVIALNNFSYLYKKHNVDMYMSLPLKNSQRFLCDYFSGLAGYIVPFLFSGVVTFCISLISINVVSDMSINMFYNVDLPGFIVRGYLGMAAIMVMIYTLTVLVASICGSFFETIFYTLLLNGLIPGIIAIIVLILLGNAFGLVYLDYITPLLSKTSPIGALIGLSLYAGTHGEEYIWTWGFLAKYCLSLVVVSAVYATAAYLLYKHRKAEDVSKPFVYNIFYYIIMAAIMLAMSAFVVLDDDFVFPMIIFMAVVYLIFEVVNKRGFKKFRYSLLRCVITIVACLGFSMLCKSTNGFGISYRVPDTDDVKSVTLTYLGANASKKYYYYYDDSLGDQNSITVVDKETIENIIAAHKSIIEKYSTTDHFDPTVNYSYPDTDTTFVVLKYKLKNGTSMTREYEMTADEIYYLDTVCLDSNYEAEMARVIEMGFLEKGMITVSNIYDSERSASLDPVTQEEQKYFETAAKVIAQAYAKDLASRSIEQIRTPSEAPLARLEIAYDKAGYIYSWDTNVINALWNYNISYVYFLSETDDSYIHVNGDDYSLYRMMIDDMFRYELTENYDAVTEYIGNEQGYYSYDDYHGVSNSYNIEDMERAYKLEKELLAVAVPHYMTTEPLYKILVNNKIFLIPDEYTSTAEELYDLLIKAYEYAAYYDYDYGWLY